MNTDMLNTPQDSTATSLSLGNSDSDQEIVVLHPDCGSLT